MPSMTIVVPHQLTQEEAMRRIQNLLGDVKRDYGDRVTDLKETWSGNSGEFSFKAMGFSAFWLPGREAGRSRDEGELSAGRGAVQGQDRIHDPRPRGAVAGELARLPTSTANGLLPGEACP